jgi:hypothetical protein
MQKIVDTHELERELRATLSAQREIGPNYDHQLVENFMQRVSQQGIPPSFQPQPMLPPIPHTPAPNVTAGMRLALAIVSIIFMVPLSAIALSNSGLLALFVAGAVVLGINFAFNRGHLSR